MSQDDDDDDGGGGGGSNNARHGHLVTKETRRMYRRNN